MNSSNLLKRLVYPVTLGLITATTGWSNVLTNPDFETDAVQDAAPVASVTGWTTSGTANTASASSDPTHSGTGSLQLIGNGGFGVPNVYQTFPASPGETWDFQGYMLSPNALPAGATFGLLKIVWANAEGVEIAPGTAEVGNAQNGANPGIESTPFLNSDSDPNTWVFTHARGVAPSGTAQVKLFALFVDENAGVGYFDDLQATNMIPDEPPPVVIDYPTNNAPVPTVPSDRVLSMYNSSGTYADHPGINWFAGWSSNPGGNSDYSITNTGAIVKRYLGLGYAGVEFYSPNQIDTTPYNTLHVDVWTPNADQFGVQLASTVPTTQPGQVDFLPASGVITNNGWISLDIPLSKFADANGNLDLVNVDQLLWIDNQAGGGYVNGNFYIDNVYFYSNSVVSTVINYPTNAAPTPTRAPANVVSLYNSSGVYNNVPIDTWRADWSMGNEIDYTITNANRVVKKYSALNFAGVEFLSQPIDASAMNTFHLDLWTPNASQFSVKLVSPGTPIQEYEVVFTNDVITTNDWISLDIPISTFTDGNPNMDFSNLGQLLFINNNPGGPQLGMFYIDNVYFYAGATAPTIESSELSGGNFTVKAASQAGFNYILQATPTLAPPAWSDVLTNAGTGGILDFSIPVEPDSPQRFFRINVQ
ncbi:MAG TPA: hypothetical protein VFW05_15510 [Verrucomicrobiae bacterium]|nr:hypothetical protein [Verrucomicrobiae bacterium]